MENTIFRRVQAIISKELRIDARHVTMNADLRGQKLSADSLNLVSLVMAFAKEFDVEMNDEEFRKIVTVGDVVAYLETNLNPSSEYLIKL